MPWDLQIRNLMNETNKTPIGNGYEKLRNEMKLMEIMTAFKRFVATQSSWIATTACWDMCDLLVKLSWGLSSMQAIVNAFSRADKNVSSLFHLRKSYDIGTYGGLSLQPWSRSTVAVLAGATSSTADVRRLLLEPRKTNWVASPKLKHYWAYILSYHTLPVMFHVIHDISQS